jgi:hypothetical protein
VLKAANPNASYCYERALDARQRAVEADDALARDELLASEARWLKLAASYEFSERLNRFLSATRALPQHPVCSHCSVAMWLTEIQSSPRKIEHIYECKVCGVKEVISSS